MKMCSVKLEDCRNPIERRGEETTAQEQQEEDQNNDDYDEEKDGNDEEDEFIPADESGGSSSETASRDQLTAKSLSCGKTLSSQGHEKTHRTEGL
ncbi:hypothetical protein R3I94_003810 [Phoxinus phoxinus]